MLIGLAAVQKSHHRGAIDCWCRWKELVGDTGEYGSRPSQREASEGWRSGMMQITAGKSNGVSRITTPRPALSAGQAGGAVQSGDGGARMVDEERMEHSRTSSRRSSSSRLRRTVATGAKKGKASVTLERDSHRTPARPVANHSLCIP